MTADDFFSSCYEVESDDPKHRCFRVRPKRPLTALESCGCFGIPILNTRHKCPDGVTRVAYEVSSTPSPYHENEWQVKVKYADLPKSKGK